MYSALVAGLFIRINESIILVFQGFIFVVEILNLFLLPNVLGIGGGMNVLGIGGGPNVDGIDCGMHVLGIGGGPKQKNSCSKSDIYI